MEARLRGKQCRSGARGRLWLQRDLPMALPMQMVSCSCQILCKMPSHKTVLQVKQCELGHAIL